MNLDSPPDCEHLNSVKDDSIESLCTSHSCCKCCKLPLMRSISTTGRLQLMFIKLQGSSKENLWVFRFTHVSGILMQLKLYHKDSASMMSVTSAKYIKEIVERLRQQRVQTGSYLVSYLAVKVAGRLH